MKTIGTLILCLACTAVSAQSPDQEFEALGAAYLRDFPELSPVSATFLGDHRFDGQLNQISAAAREQAMALDRHYLTELGKIDRSGLSRANQVDALLLENELKRELWSIEVFQEWAWNPMIYSGLTGGAIYGLVARDYAPLAERLVHVTERLEQMPRLYQQIRDTLEIERVPAVHADTASKQNRGLSSILDNYVRPHLGVLGQIQRSRLEAAMALGLEAMEEHQLWLEQTLLPNAGGEFRIGADLLDQKLAFSLQSGMDRETIGKRARAELGQARERMYQVSKRIYREQFPYTRFPDDPDDAYRQAITRAALEVVYLERPERGEIVDTARQNLSQITDFLRAKEIFTVPNDPVEIIVMPEFRRGIALAYCDSPGPLDVGQKTFYAVSPLPEDWTPKQDASFLREYNDMGVMVLSIHEAIPGHFMQIAHANRYPSTLRAVLSSGMFIEGWAVYTEGVMQRQGFLDNDPKFHLIVLKLYVRAVINAILDQEIHAAQMTREQAMELMIEQGFQEEREAAGKWVRAQLTSAQLSTYFVGFLEHSDLRAAAETAWGDDFKLQHYHDTVLSFGSPPVHYAAALMLDRAIERPARAQFTDNRSSLSPD